MNSLNWKHWKRQNKMQVRKEAKKTIKNQKWKSICSKKNQPREKLCWVSTLLQVPANSRHLSFQMIFLQANIS